MPFVKAMHRMKPFISQLSSTYRNLTSSSKIKPKQVTKIKLVDQKELFKIYLHINDLTDAMDLDDFFYSNIKQEIFKLD